MSTRSTKSNPGKKSRELNTDVQAGTVDAVEVVSERNWRIGVAVVFIIGAVLRLYNLPLVPLHHDEGVNGNFLVRLVREHVYRYDPANYHGPTLYYFAAVIPWVTKLLFGPTARDSYGLTTTTIRLVPAVFGLATIGLVFLLRRRLGTVATLCAALFIAVSPGAVYLSRYFIHETLFVFFTLGAVVAAVKFYDDRSPLCLILVFVSTALLFATKETAMISAGVIGIAFVLTLAYTQLVGRKRQRKTKKRGPVRAGGFREVLDQSGGPTTFALWLLLGVVLFVSINVLFYSSFFSNQQGVYDSLKTFDFWTKTGKAQHVHPLTTYLIWLFMQEAPLLILGGLGALFAVFKPKETFGFFTAAWAFGLVAAYSLVPYKTPWLDLNFIIPLALASGYAIQRIYELDSSQLRIPVALVVLALAVNCYQTIDLNFFNYDNDDPYYVYVYAHTKRGTNQLVEEIDKLAQESPDKKQVGITIVSPDYWPLPWYLRDYPRVGYFARMTQSTEPIIIASANQKAEMQTNFGELYQEVPSGTSDGSYELRPGVSLLLYVRRQALSP